MDSQAISPSSSLPCWVTSRRATSRISTANGTRVSLSSSSMRISSSLSTRCVVDLYHASDVAQDKKGIERNLEQEARRADVLMIWTDCDREGEHIGSEIAGVCRKVNPRIQVKRARFSAIIPACVRGHRTHLTHTGRSTTPLRIRSRSTCAKLERSKPGLSSIFASEQSSLGSRRWACRLGSRCSIAR